MITNSYDWISPVRRINTVVEVFSGTSTTATSTYSQNNKVKSFTIERVGDESKFFGFGICQKLNLHLIDIDRAINITTDNSFKVKVNSVDSCPRFYTTEVHRDENTKELSITAYDVLYKANQYTFADLGLVAPYSAREVATACNKLLTGVAIPIILPNSAFAYSTLEYGANYEGTETLRAVLDDIAEITQSIYFINRLNRLEFKAFDDESINNKIFLSEKMYYKLDTKTNRKLTSICHATELGDNVTATTGEIGTTQYLRDNPFYELRDDIDTLLETAIANIGGLTINQFSCEWRGNFGLEIGDTIFYQPDVNEDSLLASYVVNDVITYDGSYKHKTSWNYVDSQETESNPTTLGEVLKKTFARVDKQKQEIDIVAGEVSAIKITTDGISSSVQKIDNNVSQLSKEVSAKMTAEEVDIQIKQSLEDGVNQVETSTGFTFNSNGLKISKSNSEISTEITEDGMRVYRENNEVLVADNLGVKAEDLHATTFLIIGKNSRLEDYDSSRTGCFWIGG